MNKGEFFDAVAERTAKDGGTKAANDRKVQAVFDIISETLSKGEEVAIAGFGTFKVATISERTARNPQTGEAIKVPSKVVPKFKAGSKLKDAVAK